MGARGSELGARDRMGGWVARGSELGAADQMGGTRTAWGSEHANRRWDPADWMGGLRTGWATLGIIARIRIRGPAGRQQLRAGLDGINGHADLGRPGERMGGTGGTRCMPQRFDTKIAVGVAQSG